MATRRWNCRVRGGLLGLLAALLLGNAAHAQVQDVQIHAPRSIGWTVGDLIPFEVEMLVDADWQLETASLPQPGQRQYWLELRGIEHENVLEGTLRRHRVRLLYQTFYVPIEARNLVLPSLRLAFTGPGPGTAVEVPGWTFTMSPLREITLGGGESLINMLRPDAPARRLPEQQAWARLAMGVAGILVFALVLAWHYGAWPFVRRPARPFAQAARHVRRLARSHGVQPGAGAYRDALSLLHRAFDATAGGRMLATDLDSFLAQHTTFAALRDDIAGFFRASRAEFFEASGERLSGDALLRLAGDLAGAERSRP